MDFVTGPIDLSWDEIFEMSQGTPVALDIEAYGKGNARENESLFRVCELLEGF